MALAATIKTDWMFLSIKMQNIVTIFYRYNDFLHKPKSELKKIKHSSVTEDYIATEEIQNQSWHYFIESVIELSKDQKNKKSKKKFQLETLENVTITKKSYESFIFNSEQIIF